MRKFFIACIILISIGNGITASVLAKFQEYFKDPFVLIDENQVYIWDRTTLKIYIYSRKDFSKIAEFGKRGEGPGEFKGIGVVSLYGESIYVSSLSKVSIFSKKGKLERELAGSTNTGSYIPFGRNFVGKKYEYSKPTAVKGRVVVRLVDSKLRNEVDIFETELRKSTRFAQPRRIALWINGCFKTVVYRDELFIGSTEKGFFFVVVDKRGNKLYEIDLKYQKQQITEKDKIQIIAAAEKTWDRTQWERFRNRYTIEFPEYYPAYENFTVDSEKIYVFEYPRNNKVGVFILDLKGSLLSKKTISLTGRENRIMRSFICVNEGKIYYLFDNQDTETWELHTELIDSYIE